MLERRKPKGPEFALMYPDGIVSDVELFPELFTPKEAAEILAAKRKGQTNA